MEKVKPKVELVGVLGNRIDLVEPCMFALVESGQQGVALELLCDVIKARSDAEALMVMTEYVHVTAMTI